MDKHFKATVRQNATRAILTLQRTPRAYLSFVTPIIAIYVVSLDEDIRGMIADEVGRFEDDWRSSMMASGVITRGTRWAGSIELDLLHPTLLGGAHKKALREALGVDTDSMRSDQRVLVLHAHIVVDHRGHSNQDCMMTDLRAEFPGPRRILAKPLYENGTVPQNLSNIADYSTKFRMSYSEAWEGGRTKFHVPFEPEWREFVMSLYERIGVARMIVTNVKSRATKRPECRAETPKSIADQGLEVVVTAVQLKITKDDEPLVQTIHEPSRPSPDTSPVMMSKPTPQQVLLRIKERLAAITHANERNHTLHKPEIDQDRHSPRSVERAAPLGKSESVRRLVSGAVWR